MNEEENNNGNNSESEMILTYENRVPSRLRKDLLDAQYYAEAIGSEGLFLIEKVLDNTISHNEMLHALLLRERSKAFKELFDVAFKARAKALQLGVLDLWRATLVRIKEIIENGDDESAIKAAKLLSELHVKIFTLSNESGSLSDSSKEESLVAYIERKVSSQ